MFIIKKKAQGGMNSE